MAALSRTLTHNALALARSAPFARVVELLERLDRSTRPMLPVLMYHRVQDPARIPRDDPSLISATPAEFELQMAYLARKRRVLSIRELLDVRRGRMLPPRRSVVVTFDDAYRDFADRAWPVLERHGLPVTLFVPTGFPDHPERAFWWDRLYGAIVATKRREWLSTPVGRLPLTGSREREAAFRALREWVKATSHEQAMAGVEELLADLGAPPAKGSVLGWAELRDLAAAGVDLAPHSRTHALLDRLPAAEAQAEVLSSAADLERQTGSSLPVFAFPSGGHADRLVEWLPRAGFEIAFTTARGSNDLRLVDWLRLRRINVGRRSSLPLIRAQLLPWPGRPGLRRAAAQGL